MAPIFAVVDGATSIDVEHLAAPLSIWHNLAASARQVFGDLSYNSDLVERLADFLAGAQHGRTRTEIHDLFGRNRTGGQIAALVNAPEEQDMATTETDTKGPGRANSPRLHRTAH